RRPMYLSISGSDQVVEGPPGSPAGPQPQPAGCSTLAWSRGRGHRPPAVCCTLVWSPRPARRERHVRHTEAPLQPAGRSPLAGRVPLEQGAEEVVRVAVVAGPPDDREALPGRMAEFVEVRAPFVLADLDVDAHLRQIPLHRLTELCPADGIVAPRVGVHHHVR